MMSITSPHITGANSVTRVMLTLIAALIPGLICLIYFFGWGYLVNAILASVTAIAAEAIILKIRKRNVGFFLKDCSAWVTALLIAVALPPLVPWWLVVVSTLIAMTFAKHLFGGLGQNPFNPAMVAYALVLVSLPLLMTTRWANIENPANLVEAIQISFGFFEASLDGLTGATPLDHYKTHLAINTADEILQHPVYGHFVATGWTPVNIAFLIGGLFLLATRVISWHIPVSLLGSLAVMALLFSQDIDLNVPASIHLFAGSTMLAAFFIATDPVSAATSNKGKLYYGAGIGILIYLIRTWGNYPDATAFAVLLMNFAAPLIDHYTRPRVYGHKTSVKGYKHDQ